ncbi:zinc finger A20 and AN1 domain-containing stress-associated protein 7-like [Cryptomeria japonica]|uniref:zinc finger A20 and AN1 domain-containing stress-associated protein 7-like n=1 Tax=Cryptomeria japonica TaxID=3369 RepID=UPI0025AD6802|nr:zinc finger A20 and AN1 domain-containing stress-associated protein 7-like [Cryptomeria japonica]XP_059076509.1 zinc finger A20 and AN1 domain-containing stress-associated protein 7-like [Cryptomeria japonica]
MSEENNLCIKKCGFFGTAENMNMCSICYKKYMEKQSLAEKVAKKAKGKEESEAAGKKAEESEKGGYIEKEEGKMEKEVTECRCFNCNKRCRMGVSFKCRCDHVFCSKHRYPEEHNCSFDHKTFGRQSLAKNNPLIKGSKIDKL